MAKMDKMFRRVNWCDEAMEHTKYITIPIVGIRLIYRDGKYDGWYHYRLRKVV